LTDSQAYVDEALAAIQEMVDRQRKRRLPTASSSPLVVQRPLSGVPAVIPENHPHAVQLGDIVDPKDPDKHFILFGGGGVPGESSDRVDADNPKSTAFGVGQLLAKNRQTYAAKLGIKNPDTTDYDEQHKMMDLYVKERYGSYKKAAEFKRKHGWY
jgi:hypothetical protein